MGKHTKPRKTTLKTCVVCGNEFMAGNSKGMVCSAECKRARINNMSHELTCSVCGKPFAAKWREIKTCSIECRGVALHEAATKTNASRKKKLPSICKQCGKAFEYNPSQKMVGFFCSRKCNKAWEGVHGRPEKRKDRHCKQCGKALEYGNGSQFCSTACRSLAWQGVRTEHTCIQCGKVFMGMPNAKRCGSVDCTKEYWLDRAGRRRATKRGREKGGVDFAHIRERDGDRCQICGKRVRFDKPYPHPKSPSYDHILPLTKGGEHSNNNIQLTHLVCNIIKRDRVGAGVQMMLF